MLSKDDYKVYLEEMMNIELALSELYKDYASRIEDAEVKDVFMTISAEEIEHYNMVREASNLLMKGN